MTYRLLAENEIFSYIPTDQQDLIKLVLLQSVTSTNDYMLEYIQSKPEQHQPYTFVLAEQQSHGRGRQGRSWHSPYGHNIYASIAYQTDKKTNTLSGLSLATALGVVKTLEAYGIREGLQLKWPNDILYAHHKLAGILIEQSSSYLVIGVGINTFLTPEAVRQLNQPCISMHDILHHSINRNRLAGLLIKHLIHTIVQFESHGFYPFLPAWHQYDAFLGKMVMLELQGKSMRGTIEGISDTGSLLFKNEQQQRYAFKSGEVSLPKAFY